MSEKVKVSVIIPCYNVGKYISESLDCIIKQTLKNIEIICVDDGSTDSTLEILNCYAQKDTRVKIFTQENKFAGVARNRGIEESSGDFLYFFDADDLCSEKLLEDTVALAELFDADIVAFNGIKFLEDGTIFERNEINIKRIPGGLKVFNYKDCPETILQTVNPTPWNKLFRASFVKDNNLRYEPISSSNDITFASVALASAKKITYTTEKYYKYRWGQSGSISSTKAKNVMNIVQALESAERQIKSLSYWEVLKNSLYRFIVENYIFGLENNCPDFSADIVERFYEYIHNKFNNQEFCSFSENQLGTLDRFYKYEIIKKYSYSKICQLLSKKIIISVTTYPARINSIHKVFETIFTQTKKADKIVLYLAESQFPQKEKDLPEVLLNYEKQGLINIRWCDDDLRPHKKYFYAIQDFPNDLILTIDDDLYYDQKLIERLFITYLLHPDCISASRVHLMTFSEKGAINSYDDWLKEYDGCMNTPSMALLATGGAGTIYCPEMLSCDLLQVSLIKQLCIDADDLWLKFIEVLNQIPVVICYPNIKLKYVADTQETALWKTNNTKNQNDVFLEKSLSYINEKMGNCFVEKRIQQHPSYLVTINKIFPFLIKETIHSRDILSIFKKNHIDDYCKSRIDITYTDSNAELSLVDTSDKYASIQFNPKWLTKFGKFGVVITSINGSTSIVLRSSKAIKNMKIAIKAQQLKTKNISWPIYIEYKYFSVNGVELIKDSAVICHDKPLFYMLDVSENSEIKLEFSWKTLDHETILSDLPIKSSQSPKKTDTSLVGSSGSDEIRYLREEIHFLQSELLSVEKQLEISKKEKISIKNSYTWRIGHIFCYIPKKLKRFFKGR